MTQTCPSCARPAAGRFCSHCGAALQAPTTCPACGSDLPAGGRFCNQCGAPAVPLPPASALNQAEPAPRSTPRLPWIVAGVAVLALAGTLVPRMLEDTPEPPSSAPITGTTAGARAVDLSSMTPREAADRLFNRVMQSVSTGDSAQARQFLPMALAAYQRVGELDLDGHYHVAVLHLVGADPAQARARADSILSVEPNHLFGLVTAAQAENARGNAAAARELYRRFLDAYDAEVQRARPEYEDHRQLLPIMREEAQQALAG